MKTLFERNLMENNQSLTVQIPDLDWRIKDKLETLIPDSQRDFGINDYGPTPVNVWSPKEDVVFTISETPPESSVPYKKLRVSWYTGDPSETGTWQNSGIYNIKIDDESGVELYTPGSGPTGIELVDAVMKLIGDKAEEDESRHNRDLIKRGIFPRGNDWQFYTVYIYNENDV